MRGSRGFERRSDRDDVAQGACWFHRRAASSLIVAGHVEPFRQPANPRGIENCIGLEESEAPLYIPSIGICFRAFEAVRIEDRHPVVALAETCLVFKGLLEGHPLTGATARLLCLGPTGQHIDAPIPLPAVPSRHNGTRIAPGNGPGLRPRHHTAFKLGNKRVRKTLDVTASRLRVSPAVQGPIGFDDFNESTPDLALLGQPCILCCSPKLHIASGVTWLFGFIAAATSPPPARSKSARRCNPRA